MKLHPLYNGTASGYTTFGCMWKKGECAASAAYVCKTKNGDGVPLQSRVTAYWPDGTVKWTAHTADAALLGEEIEVLQGTPGSFPGMTLTQTQESIEIQSGVISVKVKKSGQTLFESAERNGMPFLKTGRAVLMLESPVETPEGTARIVREYTGLVEKVTVEEQGALKTILRYDGIHVSDTGERKLPFIIRMELGYNNPNLKFTHTFLYDGDENRDFLKGLGIRFDTPVAGEYYNRHVKFTGDNGVFHEVMVPLTAWRPRMPKELYERQMQDEKMMLSGEEEVLARKMLQDVPVWDEYRLCQDSVSHFSLRKKLAGDHLNAIDCVHGTRTAGGFSFGSEYGCVTAAIRDFWEKYPSGVTVKGLSGAKQSSMESNAENVSETAEATLWFWAPDAPVMDFRHYADRGYNQVCYEGYDYKGADPVGIACTNECTVTFSEEMIPTDTFLQEFTNLVNHPAIYVGTPEFYHEMRAFGYWSLPSYETETEKWLEKQLQEAVEFYRQEIEQRNWYGMFNYGDFMHTYDGVRHTWKYDVGGYAWANTELVPTLWLWLSFLRTGDGDLFRMAEKMSRHASEVDVYHMGKYKGLGSRHNVSHWGCPCKEARIAMAAHHRYYYYLTGDRRLEDIFEELKDNELSFLNKDPLGDFFDKKDMVYPSHARSGPDWSSLCSNWMTQWERFNDTKYRDKILVGIEDIKQAPLQLVSGPDFEFDPGSCHLRYIGERTTGGCHLQVCMGAPSVWSEMADLLEDEDWKGMLAQLGRFYYLPREEQLKESNGLVGNREFSLPFMASAVAAYGAWYLKDKVLAERTWKILLQTLLKEDSAEGFARTLVPDAGNREQLVEIPWISTNFASQFCLNTIMVLDFIREDLPKNLKDAQQLISGGESAFRKA